MAMSERPSQTGRALQVSKIRVGILGAAKIAPKALIAPAGARRDIEVDSIAARDPERARRFAGEHGVPHALESYRELLAKDDLDLIYVALPPSEHAEWAIAAVESGKAVLCEKPFASSASEARRMVAAAEGAGRPLIEAFHYRHHAVMRWFVELVGSGVLGEVTGARAVFEGSIPYTRDELRWRSDLGGGALMDFGCYPIHALRTLLGGSPTVCSARSTMAHGVDAATVAELSFDGVPASLACGMTAPTLRAELSVSGSRGSVSTTNFVLPQRFCRLELTLDGVTRPLPVEGPSTYAAQLDHVVNALRGDCAALTGGRDAIENLAVIEEIRRTATFPSDAAHGSEAGDFAAQQGGSGECCRGDA
jgi:predicted dehydrogenase